jgi:WD40 repeat protein
MEKIFEENKEETENTQFENILSKKTIFDIRTEEINKFSEVNSSKDFSLSTFLIPPFILPNSPKFDPDDTEECFTIRFDETNKKIACGFSSGRLGIFKLNHLGINNKSNNNEEKEELNQENLPKKNSLNPSSFTELSDFPITCLRWKPHNKTILLTVTANGLIQEIHSTSLKILQKLEDKGNSLTCVDYSIDGNLFATGGNEKVVKLYDDTTKTIISKLESYKYNTSGHSNNIFAIKFNPYNENMLFSGGWDNTIMFYDIRAKEVQNYLYGPHICGDGIDIKDNLLLTVSWDKKDQIQIWDLRNMKKDNNIVFQCNIPIEKKERNIVDDVSYLYSCRFNQKNSTFCVTGSKKNLMRIYDYNNFSKNNNIDIVCKVDRLDNPCYCCDYTSDGKVLAYGCADSMVRLVNINNIN